jgi:putative ABC transport system permease protein
MIVSGFFEGIHDSFREQYIHSQTGHLTVNTAGYYAKGVSAPLDYLMKNRAEVQKAVESNPHVLYSVPMLKFGGMVSTDKTNVAVLAIGVDAVGEQRMSVHKYAKEGSGAGNIAEGRALDESDPYGVIVGKGLLQAMGLKIGDRFNFITTRQAGALDGAELHVRGVFQTILKEFDDRGLKMNLATAQKVLGIDDQVHSLLVLLDKTENTDLALGQLDQTLRNGKLNTEIVTWIEQGHMYRHGSALFNKIEATVQLIIAIVFVFSIANTINMAIFERMREFGTMMAIGNSRASVFLVIFTEAALIGVFGALLGIGVGTLVAQGISSIGVEMPPLPGSTIGYMALILVNPVIALKVFLLALGSTLLAAVLPAWRASHLEIVHALGYV